MRKTMPFAALMAAAMFSGPATGQTWPERPVKIIIPFVAGGPTDAIARIVSDKLGERWKQPVVIESRPGAGANIGTAAAARADADGYTLLVTTTAIAVNQTLFKAPGYDTLKDFAAIINVAQAPNLVIGTKSLKAVTLTDALAEARAGKLSYGSPGSGTTPHLTMEYLFKVLAKVDVVHVPFKGGGDMSTAALSGAIQFACGAVPTVFALVSSGDVRGLGVTSAKRVAALPNVPTVAEAGFKDFEDYTWIGIFAPAATPGPLVQRLNKDVNDVLGIADVKQRLSKIGFEIVGGPADGFATYVRAEVAKWATVVKAVGASPM